MRLISSLTIAAFAAISSSAVQAGEATYYPYPSSANFCPDGLQPIAYGAEVSCGTPNTNVTWDSVIRHTAGVRYSARRSSGICQEGQKGC